MLAIFQKDARRLWKEIALTWLLLGYLTSLDAARTTATPGANEGWLNLILPLAWSYLVAICVLQDPLPGERAFWLTVPHSRSKLFGAKALFAAAFILAPYLLSMVWIGAARGFSPLEGWRRLLTQEAFLIFALVLPSMALAAMVETVAQYMLLTLTIAGAAVLTASNGNLMAMSMGFSPLSEVDPARLQVVELLVTIVAAIILWTQYRSRETVWSRSVGATGLASVMALYLWLPPRVSIGLDMALHPGSPIGTISMSLRDAADRGKPTINGSQGLVEVTVPVSFAGSGFTERTRMGTFDLEIFAPGGLRFTAQQPFWVAPGSAPKVVAMLVESKERPATLHVVMQRSIYDQLRNVPVTLRGDLSAVEFVNTAIREIPVSGGATVPELGRCSVARVDGTLSWGDHLRVDCESAVEIPKADLTLTDTASGREWKSSLGGFSSSMPYPQHTWFSPMIRSYGVFQLKAGDSGRSDDWGVPISVLEHYKLTAKPRVITGRKFVGFELNGVVLGQFVIPSTQ